MALRALVKRGTSLALAAVMAASIMVTNPAPVRADTAVIYQSQTYETSHGTDKNYYDVKVGAACTLGVGVALPGGVSDRESFYVELCDETGEVEDNHLALTGDSEWESNGNTQFYPVYIKVKQAGNYKLSVNFHSSSEDQVYGLLLAVNNDNVTWDVGTVGGGTIGGSTGSGDIGGSTGTGSTGTGTGTGGDIGGTTLPGTGGSTGTGTGDIGGSYEEPPVYDSDAVLSVEYLNLAVGCYDRVEVIDNIGKVSWSSSNSRVATVSNGKVVAKKAGSCMIRAKVDGKTLQCPVQVGKNQLTGHKQTLSNSGYGITLQPYKIYFNSKGDLVIKSTLVNNSMRNIYALKSIKVKVKTQEGRTVGTYKQGKKALKLGKYRMKEMTMVIKKKDLNLKSNVDLRTASAKTEGKYAYTM